MPKKKPAHGVPLSSANRRKAHKIVTELGPSLDKLATIVATTLQPSKPPKKSVGLLVVTSGDSPPKKGNLDPTKLPDAVFIRASECVDRGGTLVCTSAGCGCYIDSEGICIPVEL